MKKPKTLVIVTTIVLAAGAMVAAYPLLNHFTKVKQVQAVEDDYTCSMHHQVHSRVPGSCPICGMTLVKRSTLKPSPAPALAAGSVSPRTESQQSSGLNDVKLSPEQEVLANVKTENVGFRSLTHSITAPGRITYDETRLAQVTARVDGRIERLFVNSTGAVVEKGRSMGTIYSPDLVSTMQEYLTARKSYLEAQNNPYPEIAEGAQSLFEAAKQRLSLWGLTPEQIAELEHTRTPRRTIDLVAPQSGVVTKKNVQIGQYVKAGDLLYDIADLSGVWAEAEVFEAELSHLKVGQSIEITTPSYPGKTFKGRISFIYPFLSPETRTIKVRAALSNPHALLKPEMLVTATIQEPISPHQLAVPASAVIDSGRRQLVYVEVSPGTFRPRKVRLGGKSGNYYPVLSGLRHAEKVATSGGFLLDASSQIQSEGMGDMPGMDMPEKPSAPSKSKSESLPGAPAAPPHDPQMKM